MLTLLDKLGIFSFLQYISPVKYAIEIVLKQELKGTKVDQLILDQYGYTLGNEVCYIALTCFAIGFRLFGYLMMKRNVLKSQ